MWQNVDNSLYQKFVFKDFIEATDFISKVAKIAHDMNHHPTIKNTYHTVELWLATHEAGDIVTDKDTVFASRVDHLFDLADSSQAVSVQKQIKMYADGGSRGNPGPSASGYALLDMDDNVIKKSGEYLGITTNNQAEYQALKLGLEEAKKYGAREVNVFMDSLLVINQMKGIFKVKNRDLWPIHESVKEVLPYFKKVTFTHVPREYNKIADGEVNTTLDAELNR